MAIETTSHVLFDGLRTAVMQFSAYSDDGSGETDAVKVDVSELTPPCGKVMPTRIEYNVTGGAIRLSWGGDPAHEAFLLLSGQGCLNYDNINGMPNGNPEPTGDILLSTVDWDLKSSYSLKIDMIKKAVE